MFYQSYEGDNKAQDKGIWYCSLSLGVSANALDAHWPAVPRHYPDTQPVYTYAGHAALPYIRYKYILVRRGLKTIHFCRPAYQATSTLAACVHLIGC